MENKIKQFWGAFLDILYDQQFILPRSFGVTIGDCDDSGFIISGK